jgi:hypothetical protein
MGQVGWWRAVEESLIAHLGIDTRLIHQTARHAP